MLFSPKISWKERLQSDDKGAQTQCRYQEKVWIDHFFGEENVPLAADFQSLRQPPNQLFLCFLIVHP